MKGSMGGEDQQKTTYGTRQEGENLRIGQSNHVRMMTDRCNVEELVTYQQKEGVREAQPGV
jgi:hypothetical protein